MQQALPPQRAVGIEVRQREIAISAAVQFIKICEVCERTSSERSEVGSEQERRSGAGDLVIANPAPQFARRSSLD
jgi:hypothetical protein